MSSPDPRSPSTPHSAPDPASLLERERERATLGDALGAARRGEGRLVIVEGPPGIGKTRLVAEAVALARAAGMRVLAARGHEQEQSLAHGVTLQLLTPALRAAGDAREHLLRGPARGALALLDRGEPPARRSSEPGADGLLHALFWLLVNLAEDAPALVAVDDAHWADARSVELLRYVAERLDGLPTAMLLALRSDQAGASPELASLRAHARAEMLHPAPLSETAVAAVVERARPDADAAFARACAHASGGNPFLLHALLAALAAERAPADARGARRAHELAPVAVTRAVAARLAAMAPEAHRMARVLVALGDAAELRHAAALSGLRLDAAARGADALAAAGLVELDREQRLTFAHPLLGRALAAGMGAAELGAAHLAAARLLGEEGVEPERVAAHLLAGPPAADPGAVTTLRAAARAAMAAGAPASAAAYLRRALREPPRAKERVAVLAEAAAAQAAAGESDAPARLEEALRLEGRRRERAELALSLGRLYYAHGRYGDAARTFDRALGELGDAEPELAHRLEAAFVAAAQLDLTLREASQARLQRILEAPVADTVEARGLLAQVAFERALAGAPSAEVVAPARGALAGGVLMAAAGAGHPAFYRATAALSIAGAFDDAQSALDEAVAAAGRSGSALAFAHASHDRGWTLYRRGRLLDAMADAEAALATASTGREHALPSIRALLAEAHLDRGDREGARVALELPGSAEEWDANVLFVRVLAARARLRLQSDDAGAALEDLREVARRQGVMGARNPATIPWRSLMALALDARGERDEARRLAREELALARAFGAPHAIGAALRRAARVEDGDRATALREEAVSVLSGSGADLEHARALLELGAARRRAGARDAAREALRPAMQVADACGATAVAGRAREELVATGARPRRMRTSGVDALTASELRVARRAAEGLSNREIAQSLFVTTKAIEYHLRNAYRKLGVERRGDLADALGSRGPR